MPQCKAIYTFRHADRPDCVTRSFCVLDDGHSGVHEDSDRCWVSELSKLESDRATLVKALRLFVVTCHSAPPAEWSRHIGEVCDEAKRALRAVGEEDV